MKHETQSVPDGTPPVDSKLPPGMFYPLGIYLSADGGEWLVRDYAGQSGRFCVIGPWSADTMASFKTADDACAFIEMRAGAGFWQYRIKTGEGSRR